VSLLCEDLAYRLHLAPSALLEEAKAPND
jgi:hypothetical protein